VIAREISVPDKFVSEDAQLSVLCKHDDITELLCYRDSNHVVPLCKTQDEGVHASFVHIYGCGHRLWMILCGVFFFAKNSKTPNLTPHRGTDGTATTR